LTCLESTVGLLALVRTGTDGEAACDVDLDDHVDDDLLSSAVSQSTLGLSVDQTTTKPSRYFRCLHRQSATDDDDYDNEDIAYVKVLLMWICMPVNGG
jgi:hypothetical protein